MLGAHPGFRRDPSRFGSNRFLELFHERQS